MSATDQERIEDILEFAENIFVFFKQDR